MNNKYAKLGENATRYYYASAGRDVSDVRLDTYWQKRDVDFIIDSLLKVEAKSVRTAARSLQIFLEDDISWDNGDRIDGWYRLTECNILAYYDYTEHYLWLLDFSVIKRLIEEGHGTYVKDAWDEEDEKYHSYYLLPLGDISRNNGKIDFKNFGKEGLILWER